MKILDRYVAKNFLIGYAIAFCVLIGLRIIIDLFVNLDEFTEHVGLGVLAVEDILGTLVPEGQNHSGIIARLVC